MLRNSLLLSPYHLKTTKGYQCGNNGVVVPCSEIILTMCQGMCVSSASTVSALQPGGKSYKEMPITSLKVGDLVESRDVEHKVVPGTVASILHTPSRNKEFIAVSMQNKWGNQPSKTLLATPHHTFPTCNDVGETKAAQHLKAGDCLHVAGGKKATVEHVARVPAKAGEETCVYIF